MPAHEGQASAQSQQDLRQSIITAQIVDRPILTHLNADTTWLLRLPYPSQQTRPDGRCRYNILVDPWLKGPQSDVASWFSTQWHVIKSSVQSIAEVDAMLKEAENLELQALGCAGEIKHDKPPATYVDLVAISHEFTDHCHKSTLLEIDSRVPVFATEKAAELISSWSHFQKVVTMPPFGEKIDWRTTSLPPLPSWLGVSRLVTPGNSLYYHSAVVICIQRPDAESAEAVIYTPHGVHAATFSALKTADPAVATLAFLHGLHDVSITLSKQLNLGAHNALQAQRLLNSKYWVGTHDEVKKGGGILAPFLRRRAYTFLDALASESKLAQPRSDRGSEQQPRPDVSYVDLRSGESLVLTCTTP